jgi:Tol biopolymer transport system component
VVLTAAMMVIADADDQYSDWAAPVNLGPNVNSTSNEFTPTLSRDGLSLFFVSNRPGGFGGNDIWIAQRPSTDADWGTPQNLGPNINTPFTEGAPSLSIDGHQLYFHSNRPGGFGGMDVYVARRHNKRDDFGWRPAENLGSGVNAGGNETQPVHFEDDASGAITLYFVSDQSGGMGSTDIYASTLQPDETFGPVVLVAELSSGFDDIAPKVRRDGLEMFFSSSRPPNLGVFRDIWVSTRPSTADPWGTPVHLGAIVNNGFEDGVGCLSFDGTELYFNGSGRTGHLGGGDLYVSRRTKLQKKE